MLERGAAAARSGELAARTRGTMGERGRRSAQRLERQQLLAHNSRRGVQAVQAASDERLVVRARELGFAGLEAYLRDRHAAGWSVVRTSAELAVAREKTARLLAALGLPGMLDREHPAELAALRRVGAPDLAAFLRAQHAAGVPVTTKGGFHFGAVRCSRELGGGARAVRVARRPGWVVRFVVLAVVAEVGGCVRPCVATGR